MLVIEPHHIATLCEIAKNAGHEIMDVYAQGGQTWNKDDNSPLTEADLRADQVIRSGLERNFPGMFIWSEESISENAEKSGEFFLVDPLDGTKEFLKRNGEFTVNIALIQNGKAVAGVVFAPALNELYWGSTHQGAFSQIGQAEPTALNLAKHQPATTLNVIGSRTHGSDEVGTWLQALGVQSNMVAAGSSLKFCRVAQGQADLYPRFGPTCQWDTAAGQAVVEAAGGLVVNREGASLQYGLDRPKLNTDFIVVCNTALAKKLNLSAA